MKKKKSAQDIQDDIFRNMSAERKIEFGFELWKLAKAIVGDKIDYAKSRSESTSGANRQRIR